MAGGGGGGDGEPEFQVAPLIDVLLVMLIFFMSICTDQALKIDRSITLAVTPEAEKIEDKALAGLINVGWDKTTNKPVYKLDDMLISEVDTETPKLPNKKDLLAEIKRRKAVTDKDPATKDKFRLLVRADKNVQAKFIYKALEWGAGSGISNVSFSGTNH